MNGIIYPRMSEKSFGQSKENTYTFNVPLDANKISVKEAVERQYKVKVTTVNINVTKGKIKRNVKKSGARIYGKRSDYKKAYVTLVKGDSIPVFAAAAEEGEE